MFENLLKRLIADMAPKIVPQLLRSLADQIECGQISFSDEAISAAIEQHKDAIKAVAAEINT